MSNQKRKFVNEDQPQAPHPKKQKLNTQSRSLLAIHPDHLSIVSKESEPTIDHYPGDITFNVLDSVGILASFTAKFDSRYKCMKFEDDSNSDEFEGRFFKYSHAIDSTLNEFVQIAFCKLINYIFDYKNKLFSTVEFRADFMQRHQVKLLDNYRPYVVGNSYYFLRNREADPLFNNGNIKSYECTLLIQDADNKCISNSKKRAPAIKKAMKSEEELWNGIDGILGVIMDYVPGTIMEFQRKCIIIRLKQQITIYFDLPVTFLSLSLSGKPFKLRINGVNITGPEFFFSDDYGANNKFSLNKYSDSHHADISDMCIDDNHSVFEYKKLQTLYGDLYDRDGYTSFKDNIETSDLEIIYVRDDDADKWDRELITALVIARLNEEQDEDQDEEN